ncbi:MAG: hypothetical protein WCK02_06175 [Bacteroidota bacterium]
MKKIKNITPPPALNAEKQAFRKRGFPFLKLGITLGCAFIVGLTACKKDSREDNPTAVNQDKKFYEDYRPNSNEKIFSELKKFKKTVSYYKENYQKTNVTFDDMPLTEALFNFETLLNYDHGDLTQNAGDGVTTEIELTVKSVGANGIPVIDGEELLAKYKQYEEEAVGASKTEGSSFVLADVSLKQVSATQATLTVTKLPRVTVLIAPEAIVTGFPNNGVEYYGYEPAQTYNLPVLINAKLHKQIDYSEVGSTIYTNLSRGGFWLSCDLNPWVPGGLTFAQSGWLYLSDLYPYKFNYVLANQFLQGAKNLFDRTYLKYHDNMYLDERHLVQFNFKGSSYNSTNWGDPQIFNHKDNGAEYWSAIATSGTPPVGN